MGKFTNGGPVKFVDSHEWIFVEEEVGVVGISVYAQKELGNIVYVELPKVGSFVKKGEEVAVLESTKAAADIYSPVTGEIVAVNEVLKSDITLLNTLPETDGWLFKIKVANVQEMECLLNVEQYLALIS